MHDSASAQPSPFVEIDRRSWAELAPSTQLPLTEAELVQLRQELGPAQALPLNIANSNASAQYVGAVTVQVH